MESLEILAAIAFNFFGRYINKKKKSLYLYFC